MRQQHVNAANKPMLSRRPESLKIEIIKFKAVKGDTLLRWFVELDDAIEARRISDDATKVKFGMFNLAGLAKFWVLGLMLHDPLMFGS